ncbi:lysophospholipid acyltransferase family protein [Simiduia aestuariiviva]|uniref:1-acyl-sn-glycerol-3-phosphate acyltransferase n=1 Tax=Simiduia aestuariiviva TaxID=1510459 RepID=A0A839UVR4_9GAMM|nr:lysophospholipid acyltransferase family protein [Simiduia aestuariiviva]MBB3169425.1 1-acyl-sn-glycerol-3-phosphate acyltransferase [Simiduia aestuariiviva]
MTHNPQSSDKLPPSSNQPVTELPPGWPRMGNGFTRWLGRLGLRSMGWKITGELPDARQLVIAGGPHTSNWDFVVAMFAILALGVKVSWLGKHTIFRWPFTGLWYKLGGIPVDRSAATGMVEQAVESFRVNANQIVALMPEGTRSKVDQWKTGFLRIAKGAGVPILLVGMDYPTKSIRFGDVFTPGEDMMADLERVKGFIQSFRGKRPAMQ